MFSVCVSVHIWGGGGTPSQVQVGGGVPHPGGRRGVPHPGPGRGVPHPGPGGGYPILGPGRGVPHPRSRQGGACPGYPPAGGHPPRVPPSRGHLPGVPPGRGAPAQGTPPQQDQHSVYLLRGARYASCVHAGGLSCSQ